MDDMDDDVLVSTRGLGKRYGYRSALAGVDFSMRKGEKWALLGRNGAGKSTLIRILAGLAAPTEGEARVFGEDPRRPAVRRNLGIVTHQTLLLSDLSAEDNLRTWCRLQGIADDDDRIHHWLSIMGLEDAADDRTASLSRGQAQRLTLARALLSDPEILLFDEPFASLDPAGASLIEGVLRAAGRTVLFVTHEVETALLLADRLLVLKDGRIVYAGETGKISAEDLRERF